MSFDCHCKQKMRLVIQIYSVQILMPNVWYPHLISHAVMTTWKRIWNWYPVYTVPYNFVRSRMCYGSAFRLHCSQLSVTLLAPPIRYSFCTGAVSTLSIRKKHLLRIRSCIGTVQTGSGDEYVVPHGLWFSLRKVSCCNASTYVR